VRILAVIQIFSFEVAKMEVDWETVWLDGMINEAVMEDKHFMNKCSDFANGEYY
jgi:hypothetical protein